MSENAESEENAGVAREDVNATDQTPNAGSETAQDVSAPETGEAVFRAAFSVTIISDSAAPYRCPDCGAAIEGTLEMTPGVALIAEDDETEPHAFTWAGKTAVDWDAQKTVTYHGLPVLQCTAGHLFVHPAITNIGP